ncbi:MAG: copper-binding protein, partial [Alphaproteobacteria bacterium]
AIGLKALGLTVGWGIQFQQPLFLAVMAVIITLFACNLMGFFEIGLPAWIARLAVVGTPAPAGAGTVAVAGGHAPHRIPPLLGHFLTGAFVAILATPCSAPFLGTAVGFALSRGTTEIFLIFMALGVGLALPYLAVATFPGLATRLPRPGPWMVTLRRVLGLALAATAVWLLSILAQQVSLEAALAVGLMLVALAGVLAVARRMTATYRPALATVATGFALAAVILPIGFDRSAAESAAAPVVAARAPADGTAREQVVDGPWRPLDVALIDALVAEGKIVFVDVTADWCITCKVNKTLVLETETVRKRLEDERIVTMRGDWTLPDERIARYLESFGRYGIPFNAVYGPGAPDGLVLPELLSIEAVMSALDKAAGGAQKPAPESG